MTDTTFGFMVSPVAYLQANPTGLSAAAGAEQHVMQSSQHTFGMQLEYSEKGVNHFDIKVKDSNAKYPGIGLHEITLFSQGLNKRVQFLPWVPDRCTYMEVDPGASVVFTGPLQGCNIYIGEKGGHPVIIHANYNSEPDARRNEQIKTGMQVTASGLAGVNAMAGRLTRADYMGPNTLEAFVIGLRRGGGVWEFYVHSYGLGGGGNAVIEMGAHRFARLT